MRILVVFLLLAAQVFAVTKYVAQSAAGANDGSSAANAYSIAQLNAASPYSPAGDDIVILNGTITSQLVVPTSGTSGHPITYQFAASSKFSKAFWGENSAAAIYSNGKNFITIDGNGVGIIECTANGDLLANQQRSTGIYLNTSTNWFITNLTVRNIFIHTYNTNNPAGVPTYSTACIKAEDVSTFEVSGCVLNNAYTGVYSAMVSATNSSASYAHGNTITACSTGIIFAMTLSTQTSSNNVIAYNDITMGLNWFDTPDDNHIDGIHTWTGSGSPYGTMPNLQIYGNYIHGDPSTNCSGYIYVSDTPSSVYIYNNLLIGSTNRPNQGYIYFNLISTCVTYVYNNTIVGVGTSNTGGNGIDYDSRTGTYTANVKNNIVSTCYVGVVDAQGVVSWSSDYNTYYNVGNVGVSNGVFKTTLANWQAVTGGDTHSTTSNPNLNGSYVPVATSGAIGTGTNLSGTFTTGISIGATWPNPATGTRASTWDMGAFIVTTGSSAPTYSSGAINNLGSTLSVTYSASCTTGSGGNGGVTITASGGAVTPTYSSGSGSTTYVYTLSRTINIGETVTTSYTQPGNGIEATSDGTDVASYSNQSVTNNSTQGGVGGSSAVGKVTATGNVKMQ